MTPDEIEDVALRGEPMPDGLGMTDQMLFLQLRALYQFARMNGMSREQGRKEKEQILQQYRVHKAWDEVQMWGVELRKDIEGAVSAYQRKPTMKGADAVVEAVYGKLVRRDAGEQLAMAGMNVRGGAESG